MAFNPFHTFRKHSKVVFAGLTILCMGVFVLSSGMGRGDFFSQISDWATSRGGRAPAVTVAGKDYNQMDVEQVRVQTRPSAIIRRAPDVGDVRVENEVPLIGNVHGRFEARAAPSDLERVRQLPDAAALLNRGEAETLRDIRVKTPVLPIEQIGVEARTRTIVVRSPKDALPLR